MKKIIILMFIILNVLINNSYASYSDKINVINQGEEIGNYNEPIITSDNGKIKIEEGKYKKGNKTFNHEGTSTSIFTQQYSNTIGLENKDYVINVINNISDKKIKSSTGKDINFINIYRKSFEDKKILVKYNEIPKIYKGEKRELGYHSIIINGKEIITDNLRIYSVKGHGYIYKFNDLEKAGFDLEKLEKIDLQEYWNLRSKIYLDNRIDNIYFDGVLYSFDNMGELLNSYFRISDKYVAIKTGNIITKETGVTVIDIDRKKSSFYERKKYIDDRISNNVQDKFGKISFSYSKDGKDYIFNGGDIFGPYDSVEIPNSVNGVNRNNAVDDYFYFSQNGKKYVYYKGKNYGPYNSINKGKNYGPYNSINRSLLGGIGIAIITYEKDGENYIFDEGKIWGPYEKSCEILKPRTPKNMKNIFTVICTGETKTYIERYPESKNKDYPSPSKDVIREYKESIVYVNDKKYGPYINFYGRNIRRSGNDIFIQYYDKTLFNKHLKEKGNIFLENSPELKLNKKVEIAGQNTIEGGIFRIIDEKIFYAITKKYLESEKSYRIYIEINGKRTYGPYTNIRNVARLNDNLMVIRYRNLDKEVLEIIEIPIKDIKNNTTNSTKIKNAKIKPNIKIDKILDKFFISVDKKGKDKAKVTYKKIISKIDIISKKSKSNSKKEILNYIKIKVTEKLN